MKNTTVELIISDEFLNEMFATINKGESPWKLLVRRLGDFFFPSITDISEHKAAMKQVFQTTDTFSTVLRVEQKGYRLGDKLLRPARVLVTPNS
jgi:hypothetical protein